MRTADRLKKIPPYLFMELREKINSARAAGVDVVSLAIGDPVEPTPAAVVDELARAARDPANHRYPTDEEKGMLAFREAVARWYDSRYGVRLDPATEIVALIGSKEGCHHFALGVVNAGDTVLVTDPGYPGYRPSIWFAGAEPVSVRMDASNGFLPRLDAVPGGPAQAASAFYLNYPNNPTGAVATPEFLAELVEFAGRFELAVCYDNPYADIVFDGAKPLSFLSAPGAKDVGVELGSLSKPFNMTGWRIGWAAGNPEVITAIAKVKANTDSGVFNAVQLAAIKALDDCRGDLAHMLEVYARRRRLVVDTLHDLGWTDYEPPKGTFYLWIPTPDGRPSDEFVAELFERCHIVTAPGRAYGEFGEGYFRISLTVTDADLKKAMTRMREALG
jgi:LL-diaminopimelate aminotransferase